MRGLYFLTLLLLTGAGSAAETVPARALFEARCAICHQLPEPDMLNARQWRLVLTTMQQRMQQSDMRPLSDEEFTMILDYLSQQADD